MWLSALSLFQLVSIFIIGWKSTEVFIKTTDSNCKTLYYLTIYDENELKYFKNNRNLLVKIICQFMIHLADLFKLQLRDYDICQNLAESHYGDENALKTFHFELKIWLTYC